MSFGSTKKLFLRTSSGSPRSSISTASRSSSVYITPREFPEEDEVKSIRLRPNSDGGDDDDGCASISISMSMAGEGDVPEASVSSATIDALLRAVRHGRQKEVEAALQEISPDVKDATHGNTPLIVACQNGNKKMAKLCLRRGADVNAQNFKGNTAMHYCYAYGYAELGAYLISKGGDDAVVNDCGLNCYQGLKLP